MQTITDKKALASIFAGAIDALVTEPPKNEELFLLRSTSGTTGEPLHIVYEITPEGYERNKGVQRLLVCGSSMSQRLSNALLVRYGLEENQKILCVDPADIGDALSALLQDYAPDMLFGMSSLVSFMASRLTAAPFTSVKTLIISGEYLTAASKEVFAKYFPHAKLYQMYASMETNQISTLFCPYVPPNAYHVLDTVEVAIEAPDQEGVGEILIGRHLLRNIRMERYRIGDAGMLVQERCACGASATLHLTGRIGYDYLKLAGALLRKEEFDRVAKLCSTYIDDYRAEAFTDSSTGVLQGGVVLQVYRKSGVLSDAEQSRLIKTFYTELFVTPTQTLGNLVEQGIFLPLTIQSTIVPFERKAKEVTLYMRQ